MSSTPVKSYAPGHITGFFHISEEASQIREKGSQGAGFCLEQGVLTRVSLPPERETLQEDQVFINGMLFPGAQVSNLVLELFRKRRPNRIPRHLVIEHSIDLPMGSGLGTSGAGALSLALALNAFAEYPLEPVEAAALAHEAEILCRTGLGTVIGEWTGGMEIRTSPGAPGFGKTRVVDLAQQDPENKLRVLVRLYGPSPTSQMLENPEIRRSINRKGQSLVQELMDKPDWKVFMALSRDFSQSTKLMTPRLEADFHRLDRLGIPCAMLMFGEGLFTIVSEEQVSQVTNQWNFPEELKSQRGSLWQDKVFYLNTGISRKGAQIQNGR